MCLRAVEQLAEQDEAIVVRVAKPEEGHFRDSGDRARRYFHSSILRGLMTGDRGTMVQGVAEGTQVAEDLVRWATSRGELDDAAIYR